MFQCIIQPRNGLIHNSPEMKGVFPGNIRRTFTQGLLFTGVQLRLAAFSTVYVVINIVVSGALPLLTYCTICIVERERCVTQITLFCFLRGLAMYICPSDVYSTQGWYIQYWQTTIFVAMPSFLRGYWYCMKFIHSISVTYRQSFALSYNNWCFNTYFIVRTVYFPWPDCFLCHGCVAVVFSLPDRCPSTGSLKYILLVFFPYNFPWSPLFHLLEKVIVSYSWNLPVSKSEWHEPIQYR